MEKDFKGWHSKAVEIRFADLDMLGHVNNAKYLTYLESARMSYFQEFIGDDIDWSTEGIILAKVVMNYAMPVLLDDLEVTIFTHCSNIGNKSFELTFVITKPDLSTICATGTTTMVCYNYSEESTIKIPDTWRANLELH